MRAQLGPTAQQCCFLRPPALGLRSGQISPNGGWQRSEEENGRLSLSKHFVCTLPPLSEERRFDLRKNGSEGTGCPPDCQLAKNGSNILC
ncbi:MAG: hypothetical protein H0Z34_07500 [Brevibacillus sp.]|nr:hypothetical protein [Brevibacillus sp.]